MAKKLIWLMLILLLVSTVNAEQFNVFSHKEELFTCELNPGFLDMVIVQNNGVFPHSYNIDLSGSASKWALAVPNDFVVPPGSSQEVYVYVTTPIGEKGSYNLDVAINGDEGVSKSLSYPVKVDKCVNLQLSTLNSRIDTCPGRMVTIPMTLFNAGVFNEKYELYVEQDFGDVQFSGNNFVLGPRDKLDVFAYVELRDDLYGDSVFNIYAHAISSGVVVKLPINLNIGKCYEFMIEAQDTYEACKRLDTRIPITITNLADADNSYNVKVVGPDMVTLEEKTFSLDARTKATFDNISVKPLIDSPHFNVTVLIETKYGKVFGNKTFEIIPAHCYDLAEEVPAEIVTCAGEKEVYEMNLENKGTINDQYNIELTSDRAEFLEFNKSVFLNSGNSLSFDLPFTNKGDAAGQYNINFKATSVYSGLVYENTTKVSLTSAVDCRSAEFSTIRQHIFTGKAIDSDLTIKNTGVKKATYEVFGYPSSLVNLDYSSVTLEPLADVHIPIEYLVEEEGSYKFAFKAITDNHTYIKNKRVNFRGPADWNRIGIIFGSVFLAIFFIWLILFFVSRRPKRKVLRVEHVREKKIVVPPKKVSVEKKAALDAKEKASKVKSVEVPLLKIVAWFIILILVALALFYLPRAGVFVTPLNISSISMPSMNMSVPKISLLNFTAPNINLSSMKPNLGQYFSGMSEKTGKAMIYTKSFFKSYWEYILAGIALLLLIIAVIKLFEKRETIKHKKKMKKEKKMTVWNRIISFFYEDSDMPKPWSKVTKYKKPKKSKK